MNEGLSYIAVDQSNEKKKDKGGLEIRYALVLAVFVNKVNE